MIDKTCWSVWVNLNIGSAPSTRLGQQDQRYAIASLLSFFSLCYLTRVLTTIIASLTFSTNVQYQCLAYCLKPSGKRNSPLSRYNHFLNNKILTHLVNVTNSRTSKQVEVLSRFVIFPVYLITLGLSRLCPRPGNEPSTPITTGTGGITGRLAARHFLWRGRSDNCLFLCYNPKSLNPFVWI